MDTKELFKYRSVTACMKAAYDLMSDQLSSLLKKTWWAVLIYAVFLALTTYFRMPNKALHDWGETSPWSSYILQTLVYACAWIASFLMGGSIWTWLNKKSLGKNILHFTAAIILCDILLYLFLLGGTAAINTFFTNLGIKAAASFVVLMLTLVITLPFAHIVPCVMLKGDGEKIRPWQMYVSGLRHFGSIFKMGFLAGIIIAVISCIIFIPAILLGGAQTISQLGALEGDPLGVPGYFTPLVLVVLAISLFIFLYLSTWLCLSLAYLYGSHKTQDMEKEERRRLSLEQESTESLITESFNIKK